MADRGSPPQPKHRAFTQNADDRAERGARGKRASAGTVTDRNESAAGDEQPGRDMRPMLLERSPRIARVNAAEQNQTRRFPQAILVRPIRTETQNQWLNWKTQKNNASQSITRPVERHEKIACKCLRPAMLLPQSSKNVNGDEQGASERNRIETHARAIQQPRPTPHRDPRAGNQFPALPIRDRIGDVKQTGGQ